MEMKDSFRKGWVTFVALILVATVFAFSAQPERLTVEHAKVRNVIALQHAATPVFMRIDGVLGTAVGLDDDGEIALVIFVNIEGNPARTAAQIPKDIAGNRVKVEFTEPFRAMGGKPGGGGVSHTAKQTAPIQLGTSGGWRYDLANGYCCGGTLGSLVQIGGNQYIMSNYHVLEADIVSGGNSREANTGDPVIQPGLIDLGCSTLNAQNVATLVKKSSLPNSNVDVSVAQVVPGMVSSSILEIGTISSQTVTAFINQAVKKSGRTTGLTRSVIVGLNASVSVAYDNECAGGPAFTKTFDGQIVIKNRRFLGSGDSGSLMVEDVSTNPRAVGLLFAGSNTYAIANPIGQVLNFLGATMVGN